MTRPGAGRLAALLVGGLFLTFGAIAAVGAWGAYRTDTAILRSGVQARALVTRKEVLEVATGDSDYQLSYRFVLPDGDTIRAQYGVSPDRWRSVREGDTVVVRYAAANPARNFPDGEGVTSPGLSLFIGALGGVFAVVGALLLRGAGRRPPADAAD